MIAGDGRFGTELSADLQAEGIEVTLIHGGHPDSSADSVQALDIDPDQVAGARAFVAATESDMTNLWLLRTAKQMNPDLYLVSLQNRASNARLYAAADVDFGMLPAELIVHEVLARLASPELMHFLPQVPHLGDAWAQRMVDRLVTRCGEDAPDLWRVVLDETNTPALAEWLADERLTLGDLMRSPVDRERVVDVVPLAMVRDDEGIVDPEPGTTLRSGDVLLIAARTSARRTLDATLFHAPTAAYVVEGSVVPSSWVWRKLSRTRS